MLCWNTVYIAWQLEYANKIYLWDQTLFSNRSKYWYILFILYITICLFRREFFFSYFEVLSKYKLYYQHLIKSMNKKIYFAAVWSCPVFYEVSLKLFFFILGLHVIFIVSFPPHNLFVFLSIKLQQGMLAPKVLYSFLGSIVP